MVVESRFLELKTQNEGDMVDITARVQSILNSTGLEDGVVFLFVPGSTGALTTIEYEPGLLSDFPVMLERVAPSNVEYEHERRWPTQDPYPLPLD